ncbi:HipA family kinase [Marinicellulosiphila megalodicopiae]|uniref:HipA family kinase n=1 Tax=Marinicellulosiphila megalodicopiae TaxID=2724896 RepID=UPI003BB22355
MTEIIEVINRSAQGMSGVHLCKGDDHKKYWVKGHNVSRLDQIKEWICAHLAVSMKLPFPEFKLVNFSEELIDCLPNDQKIIGEGPAFGTVDVDNSQWFQKSSIKLIDESLAIKILLFDFWVQNLDRTDSNPNLLFNHTKKELVVIDHNLAFDLEFNESDFFDLHVFPHLKDKIFGDLFKKEAFELKMAQAILSAKESLNQIPEQWQWTDLEETCPIELDYDSIFAILNLYQQPSFWSSK